MTRVLVVRPSSLGDVVYALAIAADIRRARPGAQIDWVAEEGFAALPALDADIANVIEVALRRWRVSLWRASTWREFRAFRKAVTATRYDAVIDLQEQLKGAIIARLARGPVRPRTLVLRRGLARKRERGEEAGAHGDDERGLAKLDHLGVLRWAVRPLGDGPKTLAEKWGAPHLPAVCAHAQFGLRPAARACS